MAPAPAAAIEVAETEARDIVIETDAVRAVFTNRGAALKSWRLNRYKDRAGKAVDLVPQTLPDAAKPFQIETGNSAIDARANTALFRVAGGGPSRDEAKGTYQLAFEYREAGGLSVRKLFTIDPARFTIRVAINAEVGGSPADVSVVMGPGPGDVETSEKSQYLMGARANVYRDGKIERRDAAALLKAARAGRPAPVGRRRRSLLPVGRAAGHGQRPRRVPAPHDAGPGGQARSTPSSATP